MWVSLKCTKWNMSVRQVSWKCPTRAGCRPESHFYPGHWLKVKWTQCTVFILQVTNIGPITYLTQLQIQSTIFSIRLARRQITCVLTMMGSLEQQRTFYAGKFYKARCCSCKTTTQRVIPFILEKQRFMGFKVPSILLACFWHERLCVVFFP